MIRKMTKNSLSFLLSAVMLLTAPVFSGMGVSILSADAYAADNVAAVTTDYNGKSPYYIMVNRKMNTVTVYGVGDDGKYSVPVKAMIASCGRAGHETPTGTFSTPDSRYTWRLMVDGTYGQYASRIQGSILFHSVCYTSANKGKLISSEYDDLGGFASRGCVRLQTIDAKWIYDNCPTGTLVTIYDSNEAGALGKPKKAVSSISSSANKNWDPTDPDNNNPWRLEVSWAVSGTGHGEVTGVGKYRYGEEVTLTAVPDAQSAFDCWYDEDWNLLSADPVYTTTVDREKRLTASFRQECAVGVYVSASGTATESFGAAPGSEVTAMTEPRSTGADQPVFLGWYNGYGELLSTEASYTFTVENDMDIYAMYEGDSYGDIPYGAWYLEEAAAAKKAGITNGLTPVLFGADRPFTRAMTVQMIARAAGADLSLTGKIPFEDVSLDDWYAAAVAWANKNGIVKGISEAEFAPNQVITRQDMLVMMGRYMASLEEKAENPSPDQEKPDGKTENPDSSSEEGQKDSDAQSGQNGGSENGKDNDAAGTGSEGQNSGSSGDGNTETGKPDQNPSDNGAQTGTSDSSEKTGNNGNADNAAQPENKDQKQDTDSPTVNPVVKASGGIADEGAVIDDPVQPETAQTPADHTGNGTTDSEKGQNAGDPPAGNAQSQPETPDVTDTPEATGTPDNSGTPGKGTLAAPDTPEAQPVVQPEPDISVLTYADVADIADYALPWFVYAQEHGLLKGYEDNTVRPLNILNRAEGTVLIMRMLDSLNAKA